MTTLEAPVIDILEDACIPCHDCSGEGVLVSIPSRLPSVANALLCPACANRRLMLRETPSCPDPEARFETEYLRDADDRRHGRGTYHVIDENYGSHGNE